MGISAFLITLNEEKRIGRALDSLKWTDEQIVVDGGSTDRTVEICEEKKVEVFRRPFDHFEAQKNYALSLTHHEWVLSVDADEIVPASLANEIKEVATLDNSITGYLIKRRNYFFGKPLRFAGPGRERLLRLFRRDRGKFVGIVHEVVQVDGPIGKLEHVLEHLGTETLKDYRGKLKLYTDLEAIRTTSSGQVPSYLKTVSFPLLKWILNYIILGGFLDGWSGFAYHSLSCYHGWLKNWKARQRNRTGSKTALAEQREH